MPRYIDADSLKERLMVGSELDPEPCKGFRSALLAMVDTQEDAEVKEIKKDGEWEMFDLISSAYYGKGMYFKQDDGTVYSRYSCKYMSVDEAIREFVSLIDDSDLP